MDPAEFDAQKRAKTNAASKVVHARGLPNFTTEAELVAVCSPFGPVEKTLILQQKMQAFVSMQSLEAAVNLVSRYSSSPCYIRGKPIFFQFSTRAEIKTPVAEVKGTTQQANNILLVSVLNTRVPVTLDNIHQIFKPYGDVLKIITFVKDGVFKALVQMATVEQAINSKLLLEGKDMFQGCCHLRIGFSSLTDLAVKANGPRSRDFSQPMDFNQVQGGFGGQAGFGQTQYLFQGQQGGFPQSTTQQFQPAGTPGAMYGQQQPASPAQAQESKGCVLLVNNLGPPEKITPDTLFALFGVYGDVLRVKILFNKRDTAMIQYATPSQAYLGQLHLNHLFLYEKELAVAFSKHIEVSLPRAEDFESALLTKDYTGSPIHRFRKNLHPTKNINPPSQVLHVSNVPEGVGEATLRDLFGQEQDTGIPSVQFFSTNRTMAFVKMDSLHDAVLALIRLHNFKLEDKYLRVSFSHKEPSQVTDSDVAGGMKDV